MFDRLSRHSWLKSHRGKLEMQFWKRHYWKSKPRKYEMSLYALLTSVNSQPVFYDYCLRDIEARLEMSSFAELDAVEMKRQSSKCL